MKFISSRLGKNTGWFILGAISMLAVLCVIALYPFQNCNVQYIPMNGELFTYDDVSGSTTDEVSSDDITDEIRAADKDSSIRAIVLSIDSPGGSPVAGEEIEKALKASKKPTVAMIRGEGDSAAYMAASGARMIFASEFSDVGDIGITSSYTDNSIQDQNLGITFNQLSVGKYKDMFDQDKPLTDDERTLIMSQLQEYYKEFVNIVSANRHLSVTAATALADGAGIPGEDAVADGLVDKIGGIQEVQSYLQTTLHIKPAFCGL